MYVYTHIHNALIIKHVHIYNNICIHTLFSVHICLLRSSARFIFLKECHKIYTNSESPVCMVVDFQVNVEV